MSVPLLIVAAHLSARDRILVLDAGADDVLTQPFLIGRAAGTRPCARSKKSGIAAPLASGRRFVA